MNLDVFCREIRLPEPMCRRVAELAGTLDFSPLAGPMEGLFHRDAWPGALEELNRRLAPDPDGGKILTCMLLCCEKTWEIYEKLGISREIFRDTMGCFGRFVRECRVHRGVWAFDRAWWTPRQISGELMRIGTLEYERVGAEIALHIPSDADLTEAAVDDALRRAGALLEEKFPRWRGAPMTCESWLLSPDLPGLLPESSRILAFQRRFRITEVHGGCRDYREWVFRDSTSPTRALPEDTTLQRNLKAFLLAGGDFRSGSGILIKP